MYKVIRIMADIGMGLYAWGKHIEDIHDTTVGANIAAGVSGFDSVYNVSEQLQAQFRTWITYFEHSYDLPGFNWDDLNGDGVKLTSRLKDELGEKFCVFYDKPMENPGWQTERRIRF